MAFSFSLIFKYNTKQMDEIIICDVCNVHFLIHQRSNVFKIAELERQLRKLWEGMGRLMAITAVAGLYTKSWNEGTMNMDEGPSTQLTFFCAVGGAIIDNSSFPHFLETRLA